VPLPGDWEGGGPHGLPLSFELTRRHGHLVASSIAVGYPQSCPADERDAEAVALTDTSYAGPGGLHSAGPFERSSAAVLPGREAGSSATTFLTIITGRFSSARSGCCTR